MDSKKVARRTASKQSIPTIIGTGLIALDVVIADNVQSDPLLCAGGTCGNVLTALSYLGWNAYPIARLRGDAASKRVTEDLASWGVRLDFVEIGDEGSTPVVVQHIRRNKAGESTHSFSRKCPQCGTWLPWYKAVKAASVSDIALRLPKADVFYFDRTSRGAIELARHAKDSGSLVVFEPSTGSDPKQLESALELAHIVKIASDRLEGNEGVLESIDPLLVIETQGAAGLKYKYRGSAASKGWKRIPAVATQSVIDTAGAGDWCTVGIISRLGILGVAGLERASSESIEAALTAGQAMASWTCQYHGARGGMYALSKSDALKICDAMLLGNSPPALPLTSHRGSNLTSDEPLWCVSCLDAQDDQNRKKPKRHSHGKKA